MTSQDFLLYVLKLSILSGVFVGYYWLALRNKRFHYFNRFYLLASLILSLLVPILRFDWITNEQPVFMGSGESIDLIIGSTTRVTSSIGISEISLILILLICFLFISTIVYNIYRIYRIKQQSQISKLEGFDLIYTDEDAAPFSFLDNLFWKRSISIDDEGGKQIFKHELTHIQQKHTWDRLFTQLCCSLFWMNPFYWLIQKELETIHEFIADEAAVANNDIESFAKMLLQAHYGNHFFETKHSFFYSSIKRRLTMLTTTKNTKFSYLRRVMLLPILLISISIFSVRVHAKEKMEKKMNAISETIFQKTIDTTKPPPLQKMPSALNDFYGGTNKLVLLDGIEVDKSKLSYIKNPNEINRYEVAFLTPQEAIKKYGAKGNKGAIEITKGNPAEKKNDPDNAKVLDVNGKKIIVSGVSLTSEKETYDKVFTVAQEPASFPGGPSAWAKYLEQNLNRDKPVNKGAPPGNYRVNLSFIVDQEGDIKDVVAENNPGYFTKDEAIRVMLSSPKWIPAKQNGQAVVSQNKKSITFVVSEE